MNWLMGLLGLLFALTAIGISLEVKHITDRLDSILQELRRLNSN